MTTIRQRGGGEGLAIRRASRGGVAAASSGTSRRPWTHGSVAEGQAEGADDLDLVAVVDGLEVVAEVEHRTPPLTSHLPNSGGMKASGHGEGGAGREVAEGVVRAGAELVVVAEAQADREGDGEGQRVRRSRRGTCSRGRCRSGRRPPCRRRRRPGRRTRRRRGRSGSARRGRGAWRRCRRTRRRVPGRC